MRKMLGDEEKSWLEGIDIVVVLASLGLKLKMAMEPLGILK